VIGNLAAARALFLARQSGPCSRLPERSTAGEQGRQPGASQDRPMTSALLESLTRQREKRTPRSRGVNAIGVVSENWVVLSGQRCRSRERCRGEGEDG